MDHPQLDGTTARYSAIVSSDAIVSTVDVETERRTQVLDDNADSHLRAALIGPSVTVPATGGSPDLGRWQSVLLVECDGPRTRTVEVRC